MKTALTLAVALALTGCATTEPTQPPRITRQRVEQFIQKGKTTKAEVIAEFGQPGGTTVMSTSIPTMTPNAIPYETIVYSKVYAVFPADVISLIVQLDRRGVVIGYIFSGQGLAL